MDVNEVADSYFRCIRARDVDGLVALYADDAVITLPNGQQVAGSEAIRAFQTDVYARGAPYPTPGPRVVGAGEIAVEIEARMPDGAIRHTANFFTVNDAGRIQRLSVYSRGT
jgi:ketosteroid isomerase-like protein